MKLWMRGAFLVVDERVAELDGKVSRSTFWSCFGIEFIQENTHFGLQRLL